MEVQPSRRRALPGRVQTARRGRAQRHVRGVRRHLRHARPSRLLRRRGRHRVRGFRPCRPPDRAAGAHPPAAGRRRPRQRRGHQQRHDRVRRADSRTNNAAEVAEATSSADGAAPESGVAFAVRQVLVQEIKHFIPATKRAIADAGQVRAIIESELVEGVLERLDGQLLSGNGTAPNLRGIYNTSGISTQAKGTDSRPDAVHKSFTLIRIASLQPDSLGLHPNDAQDLRLEKDANGAYLFGPPSQAGGDQVWGVPIISNVAFTDGTPLAGAYRRGASLWIREGVSMSMTDAHSDGFIRGIVALLASMRAGFAVPRPAAFCTVTTLRRRSSGRAWPL
ncbi:MAG: phage major capsid protein [Dehalococcoidia bacterium]|nr:phage major capsid protein [Dehalococcoidia bacterium]